MATKYEGGLLPALKQVEPGRDWLKNLQDDLSSVFKNMSVKRSKNYDVTCLNGWSKTGPESSNHIIQLTTLDGGHVNFMVFELQGGTLSPNRQQAFLKVPEEFGSAFSRPVTSDIYAGKGTDTFDLIIEPYFNDFTTMSLNMRNANGTAAESISNAHIVGACMWIN